ncbi:MAG TPA: sigma-70 family RNA polymerase sigma factor [Solirubrobacteraceae bacterium]|nr:sigma-70 family RNA polymerase sigma factor [Solirubrobacteraceae bacterium]
MAARESLSEAFEAHRAYLVRLAYGTLGSLSEAEDVVQDAWLRLQRVERPEEIENLRAWLTRVVGRLALDTLRSARHRREQYVGDWLPEPVVEPWREDPADQVSLADSVSMALLVVLERLSPAERTAFVLHDVFGVPFEEVGEIVGRAPAAVRQLASRARRHVEDERPRYPSSARDHRRVVEAFTQACLEGDLDGLVATLDEDVVWRSDGGGKVPAVGRPLRGRDHVARVLLGFARRPPVAGALARVGGAPGLVIRDADGVLTVMAFVFSGERVAAIHTVRNPDKLAHVDLLGARSAADE